MKAAPMVVAFLCFVWAGSRASGKLAYGTSTDYSPLKWIEYGVYGDLFIAYPKPYSIYLTGTVDLLRLPYFWGMNGAWIVVAKPALALENGSLGNREPCQMSVRCRNHIVRRFVSVSLCQLQLHEHLHLLANCSWSLGAPIVKIMSRRRLMMHLPCTSTSFCVVGLAKADDAAELSGMIWYRLEVKFWWFRLSYSLQLFRTFLASRIEHPAFERKKFKKVKDPQTRISRPKSNNQRCQVYLTG